MCTITTIISVMYFLIIGNIFINITVVLLVELAQFTCNSPYRYYYYYQQYYNNYYYYYYYYSTTTTITTSAAAATVIIMIIIFTIILIITIITIIIILISCLSLSPCHHQRHFLLSYLLFSVISILPTALIRKITTNPWEERNLKEK